jgi:hypothetical protein
MSINVRALDMGPPSSSHQHGPPVLGRVRLATPFPDVIAPMQPSDSLPPSATAPVPLAGGLPRGERLFCAIGPTTRAPAYVSCVGDGSPTLRIAGLSSRRGEGLPGDGAVLFRACHGRTPRRIHPPPRPDHYHAGGCCCLRVIQDPRHPGRRGFGAAFPWPARSHAYASPMPFLTPSQGWLPARAGSPLAGRVSHPQDDEQHFMEDVRPPIPIDPQGLVTLYVLSVRYSQMTPCMPLGS